MDKKLLAVIKREYMERVRSKWFLIGTLIVPALVVASFLLPAYLASRSKGSADAKDVVIIDATGTGLGQRVVAALTQEPPGGLSLPTGAAGPAESHPVLREVTKAQLAQAESLATREVVEKAHVGYVVLEPEALQAQTVHYAGRNATSLPDLERLRGAVRQAVMAAQLEAAGARPEMVEAITKTRIQMPAERITEKGRGGSGTTSVMLGFGIAFILYLAIILHGQNVLRSVLEEKTTRVAEVVISSVRPHVLLAGKVLGVGLVGLTQQVVWIVVSAYLINRLTPLVMKMAGGAGAAMGGAGASGFLMALTGVGFKTLALLLGFFLVGFIFYAALYAAIGAMVNSEQEAQQAAVPVMFLLVGTFLFVQPVMFDPTGRIAVVLSWLPFSSPIIMPLRMTVLQLSPAMIAGSLVVAVLSCVAVVWLAARIYRVGMLMYGKRPSLRELFKWVRYA
jgi:ABC-2 type transport system permease protein